MSEEQKEKYYNSFTREQLIERCEYLQRSCERKENSIMELEMENADLESKIDKTIEYIKKNEFYLDYKTGACIKGVVPLLEILDKVGSDKD